MNITGYSTAVLKGSINTDFSTNELNAEFAKGLENVEPLPNGCAF
ncbi:hypothetical protein [Maribacter ulvicola]|uniref:Uncharacterized protein n=1 Tax=Maribacter ulvicola TaxID=228959 RepID=A0A1N7AK40_9FLAO|nr:hypothetical protein [Maribacter ulvicola]SIR39398.1 hypothetical protein SAMN05421797_11255 [Maribacter ulvicola]